MRKVFIDCGTNMGGGIFHFHGRYHFDSDWELYLFEANPYLKNYILEKIVTPNSHIPIHLIDRAVIGRESNEEVEFHLERAPGQDFPAGGASTLFDSSSGISESEIEGYETVKVKTVRLSNFIMQIAKDHLVRKDEVYAFQKDQCAIVLKLDVEGAEYEIIQDLLDTGIAWALTDIHIEFHGRRFVESKREEEIRLVGELFQRGVNVFSHY